MKIFNDPVHGFIEVPRGLLMQALDHPYVQRLRRIRQMGIADWVYPGATHTRFAHALGAMHLMREALRVLQHKGVPLTEDQTQAACLAILLHDLGHGPLSHALEGLLLPGCRHEHITHHLLRAMQPQLGSPATEALAMLQGQHPSSFLSGLVAGQLDIDRMDYLCRDSFHTGVIEGVVGVDRIIKTLTVSQNRLAIEEKGIYAVEKFIIARRLMYWQVYLHKTLHAAEQLLVRLVQRARYLLLNGATLPGHPSLIALLREPNPVPEDPQTLAHFLELDDAELYTAWKLWRTLPDPVLAHLSHRMHTRSLVKLRFRAVPPDPAEVEDARKQYMYTTGASTELAENIIFQGMATNSAYSQTEDEPIWIAGKDGNVTDLSQASDLQNIATLARPVTKYYLTQA